MKFVGYFAIAFALSASHLAYPADVLDSVEIGMTFDQITSKLGKPDEVESSYFIGSDTDAIRYGAYWLISREGQVLDCVITRRGFSRKCSNLGGGCESQSCAWYRKDGTSNIVKQ